MGQPTSFNSFQSFGKNLSKVALGHLTLVFELERMLDRLTDLVGA